MKTKQPQNLTESMGISDETESVNRTAIAFRYATVLDFSTSALANKRCWRLHTRFIELNPGKEIKQSQKLDSGGYSRLTFRELNV